MKKNGKKDKIAAKTSELYKDLKKKGKNMDKDTLMKVSKEIDDIIDEQLDTNKDKVYRDH